MLCSTHLKADIFTGSNITTPIGSKNSDDSKDSNNATSILSTATHSHFSFYDLESIRMQQLSTLVTEFLDMENKDSSVNYLRSSKNPVTSTATSRENSKSAQQSNNYDDPGSNLPTTSKDLIRKPRTPSRFEQNMKGLKNSTVGSARESAYTKRNKRVLALYPSDRSEPVVGNSSTDGGKSSAVKDRMQAEMQAMAAKMRQNTGGISSTATDVNDSQHSEVTSQSSSLPTEGTSDSMSGTSSQSSTVQSPIILCGDMNSDDLRAASRCVTYLEAMGLKSVSGYPWTHWGGFLTGGDRKTAVNHVYNQLEEWEMMADEEEFLVEAADKNTVNSSTSVTVDEEGDEDDENDSEEDESEEDEEFTGSYGGFDYKTGELKAPRPLDTQRQLDYIFYSKNAVKAKRVLEPPDTQKIASYFPERFPNEFYPSDHIALCCDLEIL